MLNVSFSVVPVMIAILTFTLNTMAQFYPKKKLSKLEYNNNLTKQQDFALQLTVSIQ